MTIINFSTSHEKFWLENEPFLSKLFPLTVEQEDIHLLSAYATSFPDFILLFLWSLKKIMTLRGT